MSMEQGNKLDRASTKVLNFVHRNRFEIATFEALFFLHLATYLTVDPTFPLTAANMFAALPKSTGNEIALNLGNLAADIAKLLLLQPVVKNGAMLIADRISTENEAKALKERIQTGIEPVPTYTSVKHVYIGNSKIISDLSKLEQTDRNNNECVVAIHPDSGRVSTLGSKVDRHFQVDVDAITDIADFISEETPMIEVTGLNRAQEITFVCINPENAIFYDEKAEALIKATDVSTILTKILETNPEGLRGKKVNVIMNDNKELENGVGVENELKTMSKEYGFNLSLISPERQVMTMIQNEINKIIEKKVNKEPVNITLVGQGSTEKDEFMLEEFNKALESIEINYNSTEINISLIKRKKGSSSQNNKLAERLNGSDLIFVYGDDDPGTSSLVRLMVGDLIINKEKIHALIEKRKNVFDVKNKSSLDTKNIHCIYDMVMDEFKKPQTASEQITNS